MTKHILMVAMLTLVSWPSLAQYSGYISGQNSRLGPATQIQAYDNRGFPNPDAFEWTGLSLGPTIGTLGLGAEVAYYLTEWMNVRASVNTLSLNYLDTVDGVDYDLDADLSGLLMLVDLYLTPGGEFRLSAGVALNDRTVSITGTPKGSGDTAIKGTAEYDSLAPYVGIGFSNPVRPDTIFTFTFDLGLMFQSYELDLKTVGGSSGGLTVEVAEDDVSDLLDYLKIYPVITFGLAYHF